MSNQMTLACNLKAINKDDLKKHRENGKAVFEAISEIREVISGYEFRLPADTETIQRAGAFIAREKLCCPFFEFTLYVRAEHGPVWMRLSGGKEVKQYLEENLLPQLEINQSNY